MAILRNLVAMAAFIGSSMAGAHIESEYAVKAAYLANLFAYVEWPAPSSGRGSVCVLGRDPFGPDLESTIERYKGKAIEVRRLGEGQSPKQCSVLFVAGTNLRRYEAVIAEAGKSGVLTVGESQQFLSAGGMLALETNDHDRRVHISVSLGAATQAGFRISSRLLAIARIAGGKP